MFHIVLECKGVPKVAGPQAAVDITQEFAQRPWHQNIRCIWDGSVLRLEADNDYDETGLGLSDEFSDAIAASIKGAEYSDLRVVSITAAH